MTDVALGYVSNIQEQLFCDQQYQDFQTLELMYGGGRSTFSCVYSPSSEKT
jgi:hypothetical protein